MRGRHSIVAAGVVALSYLSLVQPAAARIEQPWCANSSGHGITYTVCDFPSLEACREELISMRGWCSRNPYYVPPAARPHPAQKRKPRARIRRAPAR